MTDSFSRGDVDVLEDQCVYNGFFKLRSVQLRHRLFSGGWSVPIQREIFMRHPAVGVLLYDPVRDRVALVEQFRIGAFMSPPSSSEALDSPWLLELVAGLIDSDEPPADVARREAVEEAACTLGRMELIGEYWSSPGGSSEYFHLYCGEAQLEDGGSLHGLAEEGEDIRLHVLDFATCWQWRLDNRLRNAHTLIALEWLQRERERLRVQWR